MTERLSIVGIGASAGGLEALQKLVATLDPGWPASFVVAQHLSPTHTSMLKELLARETRLHVMELSDTTVPETGTVYIIPPNADAELRGDRIVLLPPQYTIGPKPSVDRLLTSLAAVLGAEAIGVILSGTGGDGAKGLLAIKNAGGLAIVQDPATAKYTGMPNAALADTNVDFIVDPAEVGAVLEAHLRGERYEAQETNGNDSTDELLMVIKIVFEQTGLDLSGYKTSTLSRRLQRRINVTRARSLDDYVQYLKRNVKEASTLAQEVLISVTDFFRDDASFVRLGEVLRNLIGSIGDSREVRIWNPACATGEEAYSIAMLMEEAIRKSGAPVRYKIFATDIDANAIGTARAGSYPQQTCETIPDEWRSRYFDADGDRYSASKQLRNNIVFSVHNLIQDPPFSRIDLISCRNLLIYFTNNLQKRVLGLFNYSLNPGGMLFLGRSESIELHKDLFAYVDKDARIFIKQQVEMSGPSVAVDFDAFSRMSAAPSVRGKPATQNFAQRIQQYAVEKFAPPALAINAMDEIIYVIGKVEPYVEMRPGPTALSVFSMIRPPFRTELRALIYKCRRESREIQGARLLIPGSDEAQAFRISVRALPAEKDAGEILLITFDRLPTDTERPPLRPKLPVESEDDVSRIDALEGELASAQEHLQTVVEELETSNEELQSLTEELQSANEELQSTNEELQTSNEELQSTNEELLTVNDELELKSRELESTLADLQNILNSTEYPLIVVDMHLRVTRYVPAVTQLIERESIHVGDVITGVAWKLEIPNLWSVLRTVVDSGITHRETVRCDDRFYHFIVQPYHLADREVAGAVLWFPDVSELAQARLQIADSESRLRAVVDSVLVGIVTIDQTGVIRDVNQTIESLFGFAPHELTGRRIECLMPASDAGPHQTHIDRYTTTGQTHILGNIRELEAVRKDGTRFPIELTVNELHVGGERLFTGVISDISKRKEMETRLSREQLRALVTLESINDAVICIDSGLRVEYMNPTAEQLTGWSSVDACGRELREIYQVLDEKTRLPLHESINEQISRRDKIPFHDGMVLKRTDGAEFNIEHSLAPLVDKAGLMQGTVISFHDITNKRLLLQQMTWQAQHDPLTGLVNRKEFEHRIEVALASASGFERQHALLYLDLDQFKLVNDTCGHHAGDELLRQLSGILASSLRARDTLARMGGDEFAVLLENCSISQAEQIAEKLREVVQEFRFCSQEKVFKIGVSIGVVSITSTSKDLAGLLSDADAACYAAKESGRNRVQIHSPEDKVLEYKRSEMHWVARINQAIDDNRLQLYFQPIQALKHSEADRWEVLIRLIDEHNHIVLPGVFLPAAERYGVMQSLDRWVLTRVVLELAKRVNGNLPVISVNVSGCSIVSPKFCEFALSLVRENASVADKICFELTETTAITNFAAAQEFMRAMKRLGCLFALDDFGTGMSSFGYLKNLPVDYLKIDGVFVKDILHDEIDLFMVESINRIGQIMNIRTIAEFAENDAIVAKLKTIGVDYAQGYGIGMPVPLESFLVEIGLPSAGQKH